MENFQIFIWKAYSTQENYVLKENWIAKWNEIFVWTCYTSNKCNMKNAVLFSDTA